MEIDKNFFQSNRKLFANILYKLNRIFTCKEILDYDIARNYLSSYSNMPIGSCWNRNNTYIQYDLQVIVPAYNVEKYIVQCLESIQSLILHNKRVIIQIIDDGSVDNTGNIIDCYFKDYLYSAQIAVIHQKNKGLSEARNAGLKTICGEYVMFIDSDDYLPNSININELFKYVLGCDVLQGDWLMVNTYGEELEHRSADSLSGYAWGKLYHHSIFSNLHFPEGYWYEDTIVRFIVSRIAKRIGHIDDCIYCHRKNPEGISAMARRYHKIIDTYWITELCIEELPKFGIEYDQESLDCLLHQSVVNQMRIRKLPRKIRKAVFSLTVELIEKYFENVNSEQYKELEAALRNRQFCRFELLAIANALKE